MKMSFFSLALVGVLLFGCGLSLPTANADTIKNDDIFTGINPFGQPGAAYYEQSFVAIPGLAQSLTIFVTPGAGTTTFRALITDIVAGIGPALTMSPNGELVGWRSPFVPNNVLFESSTITVPPDPTNPASRNEFTSINIALGGLQLTAGASYAFVLDAACEFTPGGYGWGSVAITNNDSYPNGSFSYYDGYLLDASIGDRTDHFQNKWGWTDYNNQIDLAFDLTFSPVPEPSTLLLLGTGVVGIGLAAWRRKK